MAVLLVCGGGALALVYYVVIPAFPPNLPDGADRARQTAIQGHGKARVITVEIGGLETRYNGFIHDRLRKLLDSEQGMVSMTPENGRNYYVLAPAGDLNRIVDGIDFGQVKRVNARHRHIVLEADPAKLAEMAPPPPRIPAPSITVSIECRGLGEYSDATNKKLQQRFTHAIGLLSSAGGQGIIATQPPGGGYVVYARSVPGVEQVRDALDFCNIVSVDTRAHRIVVEFTPEQITALKDWAGPALIPEKPGNPSRDRTGVPPGGLIVHWSFDEDEGETVRDHSGNGLHARLVGCRRGDGIRGRGVEMTGKDQYVDLGASPLLNFGEKASFTISLWYRSAERDATLLAFRQERSGAPVIALRIQPFGVQATVRADGSEFGEAIVRQVRRIGQRPQENQEWHHVVLARSETGEIELFVDGVSVGRGRGSNTASSITTDLRALGNERYWKKHPHQGSPDFIGSLDEVQIHGRLLTSDEIATLAGK
jgi:hypothetical protein